METYLLIAIVVILLVWWLRGRYDTLGLSTEEAALKALDKAASVVAGLKSPAPDQVAALAAANARKVALVQSIQAHISKL